MMKLIMTQFDPGVPVSRNSVTMNQHAQHKERESEAGWCNMSSCHIVIVQVPTQPFSKSTCGLACTASLPQVAYTYSIISVCI